MDHDEADKRKLLYEMEDKLWDLLKRRAWWFGLLGLAGIVAIVQFTVKQVAEGPLQGLQKQLTQAEFLADRARASATAAATDAEQIAATMQTLKEQARAVEDGFTQLGQRIAAGERNAALRREGDMKAVQERIAALEALVKRVGEDNEATRKANAEYARRVADLERRIEAEQKRFAENSSYTVFITYAAKKKDVAQEVQSRLARVGFKAVLTDFFRDLNVKGNTLIYPSESQRKAEEILALVKPLLKEVDAKQTTTKEAKAWKLPYPSPGGPGMVTGGFLDPHVISLSIGE